MAVMKMVEEWKCEFCGTRKKMEAEKAVADHVLRDPVLGVFEALVCCAKFNPDTDWLRYICSCGHKRYVCPHCQKIKGSRQIGRCPECGEPPIYFESILKGEA